MGKGFAEETGGVKDFKIAMRPVLDFRPDLRNPVEQFRSGIGGQNAEGRIGRV